MRSWRKASRSTAVAVALALALTACGGDGADDDPGGTGGEGEATQGGTVTYAMNAEIASLDPAVCQTLDRCIPLFGTLLRYDLESKEFEGYMAESFESEDGLNWTLKLREGVEFSDGTPFDAEAVAFNWDRIKEPATLSPGAAVVANLTWEVVDEQTLEVTLTEPNFQLPWALIYDIGMIGSPTAIQEAGADIGGEPVGAGPFVLDEWIRSTEQQMSRNENYWEEGLPYLDEYNIKIIGADDQRLNALRTGEIDMDWSLLDHHAKMMEDEGFSISSVPIIGGTGLAFNFEDPVAGDPDLQQAMLAAYDSEQITAAAYPANSTVDAYLFPNSEFRDDSLGIFPTPDLDVAQDFFDAYLEKTGKTTETVRFQSYAGIPTLEQVAQILQAQMEQIEGLTFELTPVDAAAFVTTVRSGDFQTAMFGPLAPVMDRLYNSFHTGAALNYMNYSNPIVDEALETSRTSNDPEEVRAAYAVVNGEVSKDGPVRNWRWTTGYLYYPDSIHGLQLMATLSGAGTYMQGVWVDP